MTSTQSSENEILKVDTLKRVRVPKARREAILDEFERSGLSGAAFAKLHGLKYATFANWSLKRRKQTAAVKPATTQSVDFARLIIDQDELKPNRQPPGTLRVHLPGGAWLLLDGDDAHQSALAAQLLKTLQA